MNLNSLNEFEYADKGEYEAKARAGGKFYVIKIK